MKYFVYILHSELKNKFYIGFTSNLDQRITRHNQKSKGFTGNTNDWKLSYIEVYDSKVEAMQREKQIKSWKSSLKIKELIANSN